MKRKSKREVVEREAMVMALRSLGQSSNPDIIQCAEAAKAFAKRIEEAKTEKDRDKIRVEFSHWAETDPTFRRITAGLRMLLE
jgi:hypothetical protein